MIPDPARYLARITLEFVMLVVLVATLILVPVLVSASQVDEPHKQFPVKPHHKP